MQTRKIIIGNWKMNPGTLREAKEIFSKVKKIVSISKNVDTIVCPPTVFINEFKKNSRTGVTLGAQDISAESSGAYTGGISGEMLSDVGAKAVIVGHSERRRDGDTNEIVQKKVKIALASGLKVILCVGELTRDEHGFHLQFINDQICTAFSKISKGSLPNIVIAYEPIWAIGAKALAPATAADVLEMAIFIKKTVTTIVGQKQAHAIQILYGGSVDDKNAEDFLELHAINGLLVGRASLSPEQFGKIITLAQNA